MSVGAGDEGDALTTPEAVARVTIDTALEAAGWLVQDRAAMNLHAGPGVAVREFPLRARLRRLPALRGPQGRRRRRGQAGGHAADRRRAAGGEVQRGPAAGASRLVRPLPFLYESTGVETRFTNGLDPEPRSRRVFAFHRPETLALARRRGLQRRADGETARAAEEGGPYPGRPTLRARLRQMPPLNDAGLWPAQVEAVSNLEHSLADDRPRALIQMATGRGKTFTAVTLDLPPDQVRRARSACCSWWTAPTSASRR